MGFTIQVGKTRPVLDSDGNPVTSASQVNLPYGPGLAATMQDRDGTLVCVGNHPGTVPFDVYGGGAAIEHVVTVEAAPFDWTLGDPI